MQTTFRPLDNHRLPTRPANRVPFGSAPPVGMVTHTLATLEQLPLAKLVLTDILAFNVPKIAMSRTSDERWDTARLELSNTGITLLSSLLLPPMLRQVVGKISGLQSDKLAGEFKANASKAASNQTLHQASALAGETVSQAGKVVSEKTMQQAQKLGRMGIAFGFFFPFATLFWAAPFFRNWVTQKHNQSGGFENLIGFGEIHREKGPRRSHEDELAYQKNTALKILSGGLAMSALSLGGFTLMAKKLVNSSAHAGGELAKGWLHKTSEGFSHWLDQKSLGQKFFNSFDLKGKSANQIEAGPAQLLFWGMPAYIGWLHAARSNNERRERALQSANALFWFFFAPAIIKRPLSALKGFGEAAQKNLWDPQFIKQIEDKALTTEKTGTSFNPFRKTAQSPETNFQNILRHEIANMSYADVNTFFNEKAANAATQKAKLQSAKNWKFFLSDLATPILSLSLVQLFNFRLTEKKIKQAAQWQKANETPAPILPIIPSPGTATPVGTYAPGVPAASIIHRTDSAFGTFIHERQPQQAFQANHTAMSQTISFPYLNANSASTGK